MPIRFEALQSGRNTRELGCSILRVEGGRITVKQDAEIVSGTMLGLRIGRLGRRQPPEPEQGDALSQLEELLRFNKRV